MQMELKEPTNTRTIIKRLSRKTPNLIIIIYGCSKHRMKKIYAFQSFDALLLICKRQIIIIITISSVISYKIHSTESIGWQKFAIKN